MSSLATTPDLAALVTAEGDGGTVDVHCPFDGTLIGTLPRSSREDVATAFDRGRQAQRSWERTPMRDRVAVLTRFRDLVLDHNSELLTWIQRETGKSRASAFEEVTDVALWAGYLTHHGPRALKDRRRSGAIPLLTSTIERRVPYGVVGVITPWNYPFTLPVTDSLPALLAGNAVVLKPDHKTPHTAWEVDMGSLISAQQLKTVTRHVDDAVAQGARVLAGGRARPDLGPYFYEPTVLTDVQAGMDAHSGETFGPVVSLYRVSSDDEAIAAANDTPYGLNASVWSKNRGPQAARRLRARSVNINEGYAATWASHDAPMGGVKDSGLGRRHGVEGILGYTESQTIAQQRLVPVSGPLGMSRERWASLMHAGVRVLSRFN